MPGAITLRPDQEAAIPPVREALRRVRRVLVQGPTGWGKGVLFCAITRVVTEGGAQTLILQHREELISQTSRTLTEMGVDYGIIASGHPGRDAPVQIASINTMTRRLEAYQPGDFKLLFVDEAHHAAAPTWQRVIEHFADAYVIGCTATPERLDGKGLDHLFGELVTGLSVRDYITLGVLSSAVTYAPAVRPTSVGCEPVPAITSRRPWPIACPTRPSWATRSSTTKRWP
jgi:DNA repair protein RadD